MPPCASRFTPRRGINLSIVTLAVMARDSENLQQRSVTADETLKKKKRFENSEFKQKRGQESDLTAHAIKIGFWKDQE